MPTSSPRPRRWNRRAQARPAELIAAAISVFAERGFAATRLEDVAARANISRATIYVYFANKEQLFEAVVREAVVPNLDRAEAVLNAYDGTTPNLLRTLLMLFESVLDTPLTAVSKLVISEAGNFPEVARMWSDLVLRRAFALMHAVVARGVERGEFRPVDPAVVVPLITAPILFLALWKHSLAPHAGIVFDRKAILSAHAEVLLHGLEAT